MPGSEKLAVVSIAAVSPNVTVPGPAALLHVVVMVPGTAGLPSSVTVPLRFALAGKGALASGPAFTFGPTFTSFGRMVRLSMTTLPGTVAEPLVAARPTRTLLFIAIVCA